MLHPDDNDNYSFIFRRLPWHRNEEGGVREIIGLYLYNYIIIYKYKILNSPFLPQKGGAENKTVIVIVIAYARLKQ